MIISHHGELAYGSPKVPLFAEALLLHHLDNLDSKMATLKNALDRDSRIEGEFTGWVAAMERTFLKKDRYLEPLPASAVAPAAATAAAPPLSVPVSVPDPAPAPEAPVEGPAAGPSAKPAAGPPKEAGKPVPATLFGEKLQAVLGPRK
jgi:3'-5' exoribonuclease